VNAPQFIDAFKEIKKLGGDPNAPTAMPRWPTSTMRTGADMKGTLDDNNQTFKGIFWAYDGTPQSALRLDSTIWLRPVSP
jgi:hypothetical protein